MRTLKITLAYDGTSFVGWQRQAEGVSIQGLVEEALGRLEQGPVAVTGAGRTDAGVHALGQVASARIASPHDGDSIRRALNAMLPPEVRVLCVEDVPDGFHARFSARAKTYQYWILVGEVASPFAFRFAWQCRGPLDVEAMAAAARQLEGRHDFAAFQSAGSSVVTTERTVLTSALSRAAAPVVPLTAAPVMPGADLLVYEICGDGFLRHMVRAIVGTLVEIGRGRLAVSDMSAILSDRDRGRAGPTAPACGLCLARVDYR